MNNTIKGLTITTFLVIEILFTSGNLVRGLNNNINNRSIPSNANYTYSKLIPEVITAGLQRTGHEGIGTMTSVTKVRNSDC
jgi:hypothetical protein